MSYLILFLILSLRPGGTLTPAKNVQANKVFQGHVEIQYVQDNKKNITWLQKDQYVSVTILEIGENPNYQKLQLNGVRLIANLSENATILRVRTTNTTHDLVLLFENFEAAKDFAEKIVRAVES